MKKSWLLLILVIIIAAQVTFIASFRNTSAHSSVSGTSAVVVSKLKYAYMKATIQIFPDFNSSVLLIFPNGTDLEITWPSYSMTVFLPRSGDHLGDYETGVALGTDPASWFDATLSLSRDRPIDVDVVPNVSDNFLRWYYDDMFSRDHSTHIDLYWFKIQGDAHVHVSGDGMTI